MYHTNNMSDMYQSAYRKHHSTETALLCVTNDIKLAMDSRKGTILVMIDLSPAFDTIVAERVVNAIFTSRLDYCNSLLTSLIVQDFTRLKRLQNAAARCVLMRPRDFSATDMLCELHWHPVRKRVYYKLLLLP